MNIMEFLCSRSEHNLGEIKSDSKSFYEYVRSKQNTRDKVGPLEYNVGNNRL